MPASIQALFSADANRFSHFSFTVLDILFDFSKQRIDQTGLLALEQLAIASHLRDRIEDLFAGRCVNITEKRAALHWALRDLDFDPNMRRQLERVEQFVLQLHAHQYRGSTGDVVNDVLCLGIGGSALGPQMICHALERYKTTGLRCHFISNLDGNTLAATLKALDPKTTICIISSKTFTTLETLENAKAVRAWFKSTLRQEIDITNHLIAVTANVDEAKSFGISKNNIFEFWTTIGGRFSVWSAVGLPIALSIGIQNFKCFLAGAHAMDQHFKETPFLQNMPVLLALLGIWNINVLGYHTQAIIPYDDGLSLLPAYLQQLEMESNGKKPQEPFTSTAPIIWGGVGCDAQHAYMQLLHQGTTIVPIDFLVAAQGHRDFRLHQEALVANCFMQSKALMEGTQLDPTITADSLYYCAGNKPSTTILYPKLTPHVLGSLIALYEHKVFVQGVIWGINSFDQYGVELGKKLVKNILPMLQNNQSATSVVLDGSTQGLIDHYIARTS